MRIAGYIRVSTDGQVGEDRFGLPVQKAQIEAFCQSNGHELVEVYVDEGVSGANLDKRFGMLKLLHDARSKSFERVVIAKLDRLARDLFTQLWLEKELLRFGIEVFSISEPYNGSDPVTTAMRQMIGVFAELEKGRITERMSSGRKKKAEAGGYAGGGAPIGYKAERGSKKLVVDDTKAEAIRLVADLRAQGWGYNRICDALNLAGHTTARGKKFGKVQVKRIIDRMDIYKGQYRYSGVKAEGQHSPIILDD